MLDSLHAMITTPAGAAGAALAAIVALSGWMPRRGSAWVPPDESVKKGVTRVAALAATCLCVLISATLSGPESRGMLVAVVAICVLVVVGAFVKTNSTLKRYGYEKPEPRWWSSTRTRLILGGDALTEEAERLKRDPVKKSPTENELLKQASYDRYLVWTRDSLAKIDQSATISFLLLQIFGSVALFSAGLLISTAPR